MLKDTEIKQEIVRRLLKSKGFIKSTTSSVLLQFLYNSSIENRDISASDIGDELFGSNYSLEKKEANARVNIYHLRKKLEQYYKEEGKEESVRLVIDRGQYGVRFIETKQSKKVMSGKKSFLFVLVCLLGCGASIGVLYFNKRNENLIWHPFVSSAKPTILYANDVFGYSGKTRLGNRGFHRDFSINSQEEFYKAFDSLPEVRAEVEPAKYSYLSATDAMSILTLSNYFGLEGHSVTMRLGSDFSAQTIKESNSVWVGPLRFQPPFTNMFNQYSKNVQLLEKGWNKKLVIHTTKGDSTIYLGSDGNSFEYAIAAKFKGINNTNHFFFLSDHGIGQNGVVEFFTDENSVKTFVNTYLKDSEEFVALFYVTGQNRTNMAMDIRYVDLNL